MSQQDIHVGDTIYITVRFRQNLANGKTELYDPAQVYVNVESPDGVQVQYPYPTEVSRVSEGVYRRVHNIGQQGRWWARGFGTNGTVSAYTEDHFFDVEVSRF